MSKWIDCKERLPAECGHIVILISGELELATVEERIHGCTINIEPFAIYELGQWSSPNINCNVLLKPFREKGSWLLPKKWKDPTHWMPLPKPPEE